MTEIEFKPPQPTTSEVITSLKDSTFRARALARMVVVSKEPEAIERLRAEKRVYFSYLDKLRSAVLERRQF